MGSTVSSCLIGYGQTRPSSPNNGYNASSCDDHLHVGTGVQRLVARGSHRGRLRDGVPPISSCSGRGAQRSGAQQMVASSARTPVSAITSSRPPAACNPSACPLLLVPLPAMPARWSWCRWLMAGSATQRPVCLLLLLVAFVVIPSSSGDRCTMDSSKLTGRTPVHAFTPWHQAVTAGGSGKGTGGREAEPGPSVTFAAQDVDRPDPSILRKVGVRQ